MTTVVDTTPGKVNLIAYRGDTFAQEFRFLDGGEPVDFTGAHATSAVRSTLGVRTDLIATLEGDGRVSISLPEEGLEADIYDYDLEIAEASGLVRTWVRGRLKVERDVTETETTPEPPTDVLFEEVFDDLDAWEASSANSGGTSEVVDGQWKATLNTTADYLQINTLEAWDPLEFWEVVAEVDTPPSSGVVGLGLSSDPDTLPGQQVYVEESGGFYTIFGGGSTGSATISENVTHLRIMLSGPDYEFAYSIDGAETWVAVGEPKAADVVDQRAYLFAYGNPGMPDPAEVTVSTVTVTQP